MLWWGGSIHVRPGDRGRHIDLVANLVAGAKRQGVARAQRPQANPRSCFLDVWMKPLQSTKLELVIVGLGVGRHVVIEGTAPSRPDWIPG
jgi:hypothetical protein